MNNLNFVIYGDPVGKGRPRFVRKTGVAYTPKKTKDYETHVKQAAWVSMSKHKLNTFYGNCSVKIIAFLKIPKSWNKRKTMEAHLGMVTPSLPDIDNIAKSVLDGIEGIVYQNDKQIFHLEVTKRYVDEETEPQVQVSVFWE
tara:strand:- start:93 stop:518 length:426 start_codon:yes stop_codon:yes gene_type:complete